jgi:hypothetical protein
MHRSVPVKVLSYLAVICLLSIVLAQNVQLTGVRADQDHKFYRVTAWPCGQNGLGPKTVNLTAEQYHSFKQYLVTFRERLNTTVDYKETARLYAEALTELANLHLIPQKSHLNLQGNALAQSALSPRREKTSNGDDFNICALVTGSLWGPDNFLPPLYLLLEIPATFFLFIALMFYGTYYTPILIYAILYLIGSVMEFALNVDTHSPVSMFNNIDGPTIGWVHSIGLTGIKQWSGLLSTKPHLLSCPIIVGFTGYKILDEQNETHFFIGTCLYVKITVI